MTDAPKHDAAISAALRNDWQEAVRINADILAGDESDIDALNRLGFAYMNLGKAKEARTCFEKVKKIDPYNSIAVRNLSKIDGCEQTSTENADTVYMPFQFLEDPGKTKIVECVNIAPHQVLSTIHCGQKVLLKAKNHSVEVRDGAQRYLGAIPDDLSFRLIKFLDGNNTYDVTIKSVDKNALTVFIRETSRGRKFANHPSFIASMGYVPAPQGPDITHGDKPDTTPTGEESEEES